MIKLIFHSKAGGITSAAILLVASGVFSRILGLLRDRLLASQFGAGQELDIYFIAFRIPDLVYAIAIAGGVTAAFLPIFARYFKDEKESSSQWSRETTLFVNNVINVFLLLLAAVCIILGLLAPFLMDLIAPGLADEAKSQAVLLTRIMLLSPILFGVSSVFSGMIQYFDKFFAYSLAPVIYNIGIIGGIVFLYPLMGLPGLAFGVILGALMHLLVQLPAAKHSGFSYKIVFNLKDPGLRQVLRLIGPRIFGSGIDQFNLIVITALASVLAVGSISVFNLANNIQYFPIGIIGVSFAVSSFPVFSRFLSNGQRREFLDNFSRAARQIIFLVVPLSFAIFISRAQIVRIFFGSGAFNWEATRLTAAVLGVFCAGILFESLIPLLYRVFFSLRDTKTPVIIGVFSTILNIILAVLFAFLLSFSNSFYDFWNWFLRLEGILRIEVIALPLALSFASVLQFFLLIFFLRLRMGPLHLLEIGTSFLRVFCAGFIAALAMYFSNYFVAQMVDMDKFLGVFLQLIIGLIIMSLIYCLAALILKSPEAIRLNSYILSLIPWKKR